MIKKIFIIHLVVMCATLLAQSKKVEVDSSSIQNFPVVVLAEFNLDSTLTANPLCAENKIYTIEKSGTISCFDSTGKVLWERNGFGKVVSKPIVADKQLAIGTLNGDINTLYAQTGDQIQSIGIDDSITTDLVTIEYKGDKELFLPKQSGSKSAIIFGTTSGNIYCLDLETLQEYWRNNDAHGLIISQPVSIENKILFTGSDGYLYSIDARNGLLNWRWKETAETDFSNALIICDGKKVFVVSKDSQLYCIDLLLGKLIWKADKVKVLPAIGISLDRKNLFVKSADKRFLILSAYKGIVLKQIKRDDDFDITLIPPFESDGKIYFTNKNSIFALDKKFKEEVILEFGETTINTFQLISENKFLVSTTSGTILIFKPRK